jgi:uroporphyrin-3 C-methyltransferase
MTDTKQDNNTKQTNAVKPGDKAATTNATVSQAPPAKGGGKGIGILALIVALAAGGGSAYLWSLWNQQKAADAATLKARLEETLSQVAADRDSELNSLKDALKAQQEAANTLQDEDNELRGQYQEQRADLQTLTEGAQVLTGDIRALQGDIQTLKGTIETQKGAYEIQRTDVRTLQSDIRALQESIQGLQGGMQSFQEGLDTQKGGLEVRQQEILALQEETQALQGGLQSLRGKIASLGEQQSEAEAELGSRLENIQLGLSGLRRTVEVVKEVAAKGGDVNAFALSEVEYLLRLADHKVRLERDIPSALEALTTASERLATVKENAFNAVKRMIAENIAGLRGVELPDRSAMAYKLAEMATQVDELLLLNDMKLAELTDRVKPNIAQGQAAADDSGSWWEQASSAAMGHLKDMVSIRKERSSSPPLIAVEEEYFLRQNLRLQLEAMRIALLGEDAANYQASDQLARNWLRAYFDVNDPKVAGMLSELEALQKLKFNPYVPDISPTLQAFLEIMERRSPVRSVAVPAATEAAAETETGEMQQ